MIPPYRFRQKAVTFAISAGNYNAASEIYRMPLDRFRHGIPPDVFRLIYRRQKDIDNTAILRYDNDSGISRRMIKHGCKSSRRSNPAAQHEQEGKNMKRYDEAQNYIDAGILKYSEILADCEEIARTDRELKESMIEQAGTIADYAAEIFAAVQDITK